MDFISSFAKGGDSKKQPAAGEEKPSTADILADAKVVSEAARAQFSNQAEKCDKAKAAASAADLLDAASDYGKLDETQGVGKYVDQAEGYLRQYSGPNSTTAAAAAVAGEDKPAAATGIPSGEGEHIKKAEESVDGGEYVKKAEEKGESEGGYGDLMKAAGGFFNK
ncbi:nodulin-related protein 2-like [Salvia miltiorrhiza]|uniref:nodulin-related protein 2-like n=1 Tax=Salvia miltiorrhiza TaxID=226208 RepID=UPI0025ACBB64|nr:nodulin-related protein 2-like [Salvia miltiorrhiza]